MKSFFGTILDVIVRNPLTTIFVVLLMVAAPGLFGAFAVVIIVLMLLGLLSWAALVWRLRRVQREAEEQMRNHAGGAGHTSGGGYRRARNEGDVTVHAPAHQEKRVSETVGEYVDFKEVKEERD